MGVRYRLLLWFAASMLVSIPGTLTFAQTKITIGVAAMSPRTIPLIIAQEQGLLAKQGIETRIVLIKGAPTLVARISGDIEVGYTGGTAVLGAASQGLYLKILSSISSKLTHTLVASPGLKPPSSCAANASAFKASAAAPGCTPYSDWSMSVSTSSATISVCS